MSDDLTRAFELDDADLAALCAKYKLGPRALRAVKDGVAAEIGPTCTTCAPDDYYAVCKACGTSGAQRRFLARRTVPCSFDCAHELCVALRRRARRDRVLDLRLRALAFVEGLESAEDVAAAIAAVSELARLALGEPL